MTQPPDISTVKVGEPAERPRVVYQLPSVWARVACGVDSFPDLFFIQFSSVRTAWHWLFLVSSAWPLALLFFLSFVAGSGNPTTLLQHIVGNVVIALMISPLFMVSGQFSWARQTKAFDFYAGLPISRTALVLAAMSVAAMFTIPGAILLLVLGMLVFHLWLVPSPLIVLIILLSPIALAGVGASIGVVAPTQNVAGVTCNLVMIVIMFLSPVLVPLSKLPAILQITSHLLPTTYAADALRQALTSRVTISAALDLVVLVAFCVATMYLATARLDWRSA